jgi:hypothetical protein
MESRPEICIFRSRTPLSKKPSYARREAELAVFDFIEAFYNPRRRHSSLGYLAPVAFENQQTPKQNRVRDSKRVMGSSSILPLPFLITAPATNRRIGPSQFGCSRLDL